MEQVGVQFIAAGGDVYITTLNSATKSTNTFVDATEKGGGRVSGAGQVMIGALRQVGTIAVDAFAQAAKATAAFVGDSINIAGDFEAGMHKFQAVAGKGVDTKGLEKFKDLFISLGKELPVSTSEVEQAAIEMVSGGIDPAIVAGGALRQTIQFAAASGLSLADAAKTSAKFLAGWTSSAATTAEKVDFLTLSTDVLTKAAAASSTTASELRLGLFNVQGAAQALHASFSDTTATLALLAPAFESSAQAGTALNVFMTRLVPQTDSAAGAMENLGLITKDGQNVFFDTQGNFLGMGNAAEQLKQKLGALTDEQKIDTLHRLFGNDAMKVGNLLMQDGAAGLEGMIAKMNEANGVQSTAALMQSGYNTALENAKGSVEALQITIGSALLPVLTDLMNNAALGINALSNVAKAFFDAGAMSSDFAIEVGNLAESLGLPGNLIEEMVLHVQEVVGAFNDAGAMSSDFAIEIGNLAEFLGLPGNLIEGIVLSAQELVQWFGTASDKSSDLGGVVNDLSGIWGKAGSVVNDVMVAYQAIATAVLPIVTKFVNDHGTEISAFFKTSYDKIISIVNLALDLYDAVVPHILDRVATFISAHANAIETIFSGAWHVISGTIEGALTLIEGTFKIALDLIHGDWSKAWTDLQDMSANFVLSLEKTIEGFLNIIAGFFDTSLQGIVDVWKHNWEMLIDIATKTDWIAVGQSVVDGIQKGLSDAWGSLVHWIEEKMGGLFDAAMAKIKGGSPALEFVPIGASVVEGILKGLADTAPALIDLVNQTGTDMINALTKNIAEGGDAIRKQMGQLTDDIKSISAEINAAIGDAFGATATVDRQMAKNLEDIQKISPELRQGVMDQLRGAQQEAAGIADPVESARLYQLRSKQIMELANLQTKLADAQQVVVDTTEAQLAPDVTQAQSDAAIAARQAALAQIDLLQQQIELIRAAQQAERSQNAAGAAGQTSQVAAIADQISALFSGSDLANNLPGILENPLIRQLFGLLDQLRNIPHLASGGFATKGNPFWVGEHGPELFWPSVNGTVSPAASSAQMARGSSTTYNGQVGNSYSMPIYTNNTPSALQQSLAIAQAAMP